MPKYRVYGLMTASVEIGVFDADTPEDAINQARENGEFYHSLCHHCAREIDLGDIYTEEAEEIEP